MNTSNIYPYLSAGSVEPAWAELALPIGHGLHAALFEDQESATGIVHLRITPEQLSMAGLTVARAHELALENLTRFADESPALSIQVLGDVGSPLHFLLYSDHPRAAACLRLPDLYEQACEHLQSDQLCACVPQQESLVVFPKRDRAFRDLLVGKLREIEADAAQPLTFELFDLSAGGIKPFMEC